MNRYEKKAQKEKTSAWLNDMEDTASDRELPMGTRVKKGAGSAAIKLLSAIGGGFTGAAIGRWSVVGGILTTGAGEVVGSPEMTSFGVGMMASNLIPTEQPLDGTEETSTMNKAKSRVQRYGKGLMHKFFLDKLIKKGKDVESANETEVSAPTPSKDETPTLPPENTVSGIDYYQYPVASDLEIQDDLSELDKYEQELKESSEEFLLQQDKEDNPNTPVPLNYDQDESLEDDPLF